MGDGEFKSSGDFLRSISPVALPDDNNLSGLDQINFVTDMVVSGCFTTKFLSVQTIFPTALEAVIAYFDADLGDAIRFIFRPKGLFRGNHKKGGGGGRNALRRFGAVAALQDRKMSSGANTIWRMDTIAQRLFWYVMVYDVATDFIYNFATLMVPLDSCGPGSAFRTGFDGNTVQTLGAWVGPVYGIRGDQQGTVTNGGAGFNLLAGHGTAAGGVNFKKTTSDPPTIVSLRVTWTGAGRHLSNESSTQVKKGATGSLAVSLSLPGPGTIVFEIRTQGFAVVGTGGDGFVDGQ